MRDPFEVVARQEERERNARAKTKQGKREKALQDLQALFGGDMTQEQSEKLEDYLLIWYEWTRKYFPNLDSTKVSIYAKQAVSSDVYADEEDAEEQWKRSIAEAVEACVNDLTPLQRSAVDIHCCAKLTGASVLRNTRMTIEEHHRQYQEAKKAIFDMPRMRDLLL